MIAEHQKLYQNCIQDVTTTKFQAHIQHFIEYIMDTKHNIRKSSTDEKAHATQQQQLSHQQYQQQQESTFSERAFTKISTIKEEESSMDQESTCYATNAPTNVMESDATAEAYDADVDDVVDVVAERSPLCSAAVVIVGAHDSHKKVQSERDHIYELFQPWALKTYGDQAKTKTITMRKKARILKALEGKEHSRPDSSKFRFWVKTKAFTTKRPEGFSEVLGSQRKSQNLPPNSVLSDNPSEVDLFVASTSKDLGQRSYRKVAVVEEFFDIIYNVHMELGGRSGMHAGQKRTYRIITETYAFLPREAVTRFLSTCPECKKNLRPSSPATSSHNEEPTNESSSEMDVLNYSSHTESSIEAGPTKSTSTKAKKRRRNSNQPQTIQTQTPQLLPSTTIKSEVSYTVEPHFEAPAEPSTSSATLDRNKSLSPPVVVSLQSRSPPSTSNTRLSTPIPTTVPITSTDTPTVLTSSMPKIRINPNYQRRAPSPVREPLLPSTTSFNPLCFDFASLKSHESLFRYYEFMRRFYGGNHSTAVGQQSSPLPAPPGLLTPPIYATTLLQSLRFPTGSSLKNASQDIQTPKTESVHSAESFHAMQKGQSTEPIDLNESAHAKEIIQPSELFPCSQSLLSKAQFPSKSSFHSKEPIGSIDLISDDDDYNDDDDSSAPPTPKKHKSLHNTQVVSSDILQFKNTQSLKAPLSQSHETQSSAINLTKASFNFSSNGTSIAETIQHHTTLSPAHPPSTHISSSSSATSTSVSSCLATRIKVESSACLPTQFTTSTTKSTCRHAVLPHVADCGTALRIPQIRAGILSSSLMSSSLSSLPLSLPPPPTSASTSSFSMLSSSSSSLLPPLDLERLKPITSTYLQLTRSMGLSDEDALRFDNLDSEPMTPNHKNGIPLFDLSQMN